MSNNALHPDQAAMVAVLQQHIDAAVNPEAAARYASAILDDHARFAARARALVARYPNPYHASTGLAHVTPYDDAMLWLGLVHAHVANRAIVLAGHMYRHSSWRELRDGAVAWAGQLGRIPFQLVFPPPRPQSRSSRPPTTPRGPRGASTKAPAWGVFTADYGRTTRGAGKRRARKRRRGR